jgi:hypothetical protein
LKEKVASGTMTELVAELDSDAMELGVEELRNEDVSVDGVPEIDWVLLVGSVDGVSGVLVALVEELAAEETAEVDSAVVVGSDVVVDRTVETLLLLLLAVSENEVMLVLVGFPQRRRTTRGDAKADPRLARTKNVENSILIIPKSCN